MTDCPECGAALLHAEHGDSDEELPAKAIGMAVGGALVGAAVWAAVAHFANYEIGWLAWGLGGLVGWATLQGGGRGMKAAVMAAVLAAASIGLGRVAGIHFSIEKELGSMFGDAESIEGFQEFESDGKAYFALADASGDKVLQQFLDVRGYVGTGEEGAVTMEDVAQARVDTVPGWLTVSQPGGLEKYKQQMTSEIKGDFSLWEAFKESFGMLDLLFLGLGVVTAFKMVGGL